MNHFTTNMLHMGYRTLIIALAHLCFTNSIDAQDLAEEVQISPFFSWPENMRSMVHKSLVSRSGDSLLLSIPLEAETLEFYINNHDFIKTPNQRKNRLYHPFSGKDRNQNAVFGYFLEGDIFLSFYRDGQVTEIAPETGIEDLYYIRHSADPEAQGEIECAVDEIMQPEIRRGGHSVPCQSQNYGTYTLRLYLSCTGEWGAQLGGKEGAKQGALIFKAMF